MNKEEDMFLDDLVRDHRSIREYTDEPVSQEEVESILEAGLECPTAINRKPVELIAVEDPETLTKLADLKTQGSQFISKAPLAIVVIVDTELGKRTYVQDASISAAFIRLQAQSLGLGSCWVNIPGGKTEEGQSSDDYVKELLGIPDRYTVNCVIPVGHPAETPERKPFNYKDKVHREKF